MNLKIENGITIIALIITIVIMIILAAVGIEFGNDAVNNAKLEDIKTNMISIKTKAKIVTEQYNFKDIDSLVGNVITDDEATKLNLTNSENIRKWSSSDLSSQNLSNIEGDAYIVSYDLENPNNCEVYYLKGYEGKYSLTELQEL
ncbi:MAG: hypothetical protein IJE59_02165 [Clostridia bacterium]|nr:hypothetical protein [Clostridia bacterium]